jgi:probable F420-dependent oxidoreductase
VTVRLGITSFLTDRSMGPGELAQAVEERGFASLYLPEHTHLPVRTDVPPASVEGVDPGDYRRGLDPLVALAMAAQATERIALGTGVLLVAQHDPIILAKQVATLDHLSGGRVVLGIGFGWNRAEAEDHGVDFSRRREVAREHVLCMQALWGADPVSFEGEHVRVPPCWARPKPIQRPRVRTLVGGGATGAVFSAVAEFADGWLPIGGAGIGPARDALAHACEEAGRDPAGIDVVPFGTIPDRGKLDHFASLGVTEVVCRVPAGDRDDMLRRLDDYAALLTGGGTAPGTGPDPGPDPVG